jgi:hypothetical protein
MKTLLNVVGNGSTPSPLLTKTEDVFTCHTERRKTKIKVRAIE